ncbi:MULTISPECIES: hypothetical protein [unclassified Devosia]|uniref:hypothetical protein n=1 Tax=unclassified Devosia TaxID=196773 RepID=UPI00086E31C5|nr:MULTISPECIES: hypothetical protein [unclassified Devosia]MBN9361306.1 hypothetical protein [Devosia sp.]ODS94834.1 MAG: hypothetical protein ABS47_04915 [Devosia sp. SCN 66-27]OJX26391.1 MAG: hypothetical protein BGO83_21075 [Devosia sp. 66-14]
MKFTWFGGTTIRIHIGGRILVADPAGVSGVDPEELVSGADATFALDGSLPEIDPVLWQPGRPGSMLDEDVLGEVTTHGLEGGALIAAVGEAPLLLLSQSVPKAGRWARDSVLVVFGDHGDQLAAQALERFGPRLIAVAGPDAVVERTFAAQRDRLDGTALVALEAGMALEV